jgi:DNA polymerase-1
MGVRSLSRGTGFSQTEATQFIAKYFEIHKGIAKYITDTKAYAHANGYVKTAWGRRRYLPEIESGIQMLVAQAERMAINTPLQGTKADVVKQAMIDVDAWIKEQGFNIRPLLQVHDELVFEIPVGEVASLVPQIQKVMESVWVGRVKLTANCKVGSNWGNMSAL